MTDYYARLSNSKHRGGDSADLVQCIERVVNQLNATATTLGKPGMLLGKIQSGKTRGFLGVIAKSFDRGFDIAVVLTKGTKTLVRQTVQRIESEFEEFIEAEEVLLFDIMHMPETMTKSERKRKMIIVAKKQDKNLARLLTLFNDRYPELKSRRVLLVDDEADMASVRFVRNQGKGGKKKDDRAGDLAQGTIAQQMDDLRASVDEMAFLQVTATPYALYLQPDEYISQPDGFVFYPKRPAFTELLPIHGGYVGGDDYFGDFSRDDPRSFLHVAVPEDEQNALRAADGRQIRSDRYWTSKNIAVLRRAFMTFLAAVVVRRWQQADQADRPRKYTMIIHNDTQRAAHTWQWKTVEGLREDFEKAVIEDDPRIRTLFDGCFKDLVDSVKANKGRYPSADDAFVSVCELISDGEINVQRVNSDQDLQTLLDPRTAELKLRTHANIFIGGSILDRGITVPALIAFYYGRNPKRMQADTVLQHSRMYGNRDRQDLAVTRFYTSPLVRERLEAIHKLEKVLRDAFERDGDDAGVVFIQKDSTGGVVPCAPSKILASDVVSVKANDLYLPSGFNTVAGAKSFEAIDRVDRIVEDLGVVDSGEITSIPMEDALEIMALTRQSITGSSDQDFDWSAMEGLMKYYARQTSIVGLRVETGRRIDRSVSGDKSGLSILGGGAIRAQIRDATRLDPTLILLRQDGTKQLNWAADHHFWWPILAIPSNVEPCVFATEARG